jgi:predicted AlkP superfamily phosphohydrolase/phosphomutase
LFAAAKSYTPTPIKKLYYKNVSAETAHRVAHTTMLPAYDWKRTRAFSLPSDQHGWIRINLSGREKLGVVEANRYEQTCEELEKSLRGVRDVEGNLLVNKIIRTPASVEEALTSLLPDLVVHWETPAFKLPLELKNHSIQFRPSGTKFTGQHSLAGFCIVSEKEIVENQDVIRGTELADLIRKMCN